MMKIGTATRTMPLDCGCSVKKGDRVVLFSGGDRWCMTCARKKGFKEQPAPVGS